VSLTMASGVSNLQLLLTQLITRLPYSVVYLLGQIRPLRACPFACTVLEKQNWKNAQMKNLRHGVTGF
jgi:hypothetical protein